MGTPIVRGKTCCVCGADAGRWAQHYNRDTGYGICRPCVDRLSPKMGAAEIADLYGKEGVNFAPVGVTKSIEPPIDWSPLSQEATELEAYARDLGLTWIIEWRSFGEVSAFATFDASAVWQVIGETSEQARACISLAAASRPKKRQAPK